MGLWSVAQNKDNRAEIGTSGGLQLFIRWMAALTALPPAEATAPKPKRGKTRPGDAKRPGNGEPALSAISESDDDFKVTACTVREALCWPPSSSSLGQPTQRRNLVFEVVQQAKKDRIMSTRLQEALCGCIWMSVFEAANIPPLMEDGGIEVLLDVCSMPQPRIKHVQVCHAAGSSLKHAAHAICGPCREYA